jgi:hypothetical protein
MRSYIQLFGIVEELFLVARYLLAIGLCLAVLYKIKTKHQEILDVESTP